MLSPRLMLIPTSCMEDTMDLDTMVLDMDTTDIPMLTMARDLLMLSLRLKLILTSSTVDITDLVMPDMVFIILPMVAMLIMERDLPMLSPRLMLTPTFFMVDIMDLVMPDMDFTILPMVVMLTMERDLPMLKPRLIPMCMVDTMDSVDTVVMVDMDLDVVSTLDKQRISSH